MHWAIALVQAVVALNVVSHLAAALVLRSYTPGLASAVTLNLPFSVYVFRRATSEGWFGRRERWALVPAALLVHGPGLILLFLLARVIARFGLATS